MLPSSTTKLSVPKIEPGLHQLAIALGVRHPARRVRGEIGVFGEDVGGTYELGQLREPACIADANMEGIIGLRLAKLRGGEKALAQRRHAEIDEGVLKPFAAMAAAMLHLDRTHRGFWTRSIHLHIPRRRIIRP